MSYSFAPRIIALTLAAIASAHAQPAPDAATLVTVDNLSLIHI